MTQQIGWYISVFKRTLCGNMVRFRVHSDPVGPTPGHFRLFVQPLFDTRYCKSFLKRCDCGRSFERSVCECVCMCGCVCGPYLTYMQQDQLRKTIQQVRTKINIRISRVYSRNRALCRSLKIVTMVMNIFPYLISHIYQQVHNSKIKNHIQSTGNCCTFRLQGAIFRELQIQESTSTSTLTLILHC